MNSTNRRFSPSLIISILALFIAVGGTSYAAVKINGKNIKPNTVAGKALKKNTLTGNQINENKLGIVPKAKIANDAMTLAGKSVEELTSPAAYAYINASGGTVDVPADSALGIAAANVTKENSFVCINGLDFEPKNVSVTTYRVGGGTSNDVPNVTLDDSNFCDGAEQVAVQMVSGETGNPNANGRFYITLFR